MHDGKMFSRVLWGNGSEAAIGFSLVIGKIVMKRKVLFLFSVVFICNFGYQLIEFSGDPSFRTAILTNNIFLVFAMLFFSYIIFFMKNSEVEKKLKEYYSSFNIKIHQRNQKCSFDSLFCWFFFSYVHYHLLTFAGSFIFPILYSFPTIMDRLTIDLIYNIEYLYGWVVRLLLIYPLPFIFFNIVRYGKRGE